MIADTDHLITLIDAALPQWQCGQCNTPGCRTYAEAIVQGEAINLCIPGGEPMVAILAGLTGRPVMPVAQGPYPLLADGRPEPMRAVIRESECIGCTKCIDACPVDAILGTGKMMHTVLTDLCTGCDLCIPSCPVDCIDMVPLSALSSVQADAQADTTTYLAYREEIFKQDQVALKARFDAKQAREASKQAIRLSASRFAKTEESVEAPEQVSSTPPTTTPKTTPASSHADPIRLATLRSQIKKLEKQMAVMPNATKQLQLIQMQQELAALQSTTDL